MTFQLPFRCSYSSSIYEPFSVRTAARGKSTNRAYLTDKVFDFVPAVAISPRPIMDANESIVCQRSWISFGTAGTLGRRTNEDRAGRLHF